MGVHDHDVYHARHSSHGGNPQLPVLLQCGGSTGCARSASHSLLLFPRPTVWTYRLSVTFRSTSLSDRPRVRIDRQAVKLITKAYRLTLAVRSTSSGRPFAVAVGYLGLSGRLVIVVMHCCVTAPNTISASFWQSVVGFTRCNLHQANYPPKKLLGLMQQPTTKNKTPVSISRCTKLKKLYELIIKNSYNF